MPAVWAEWKAKAIKVLMGGFVCMSIIVRDEEWLLEIPVRKWKKVLSMERRTNVMVSRKRDSFYALFDEESWITSSEASLTWCSGEKWEVIRKHVTYTSYTSLTNNTNREVVKPPLAAAESHLMIDSGIRRHMHTYVLSFGGTLRYVIYFTVLMVSLFTTVSVLMVLFPEVPQLLLSKYNIRISTRPGGPLSSHKQSKQPHRVQQLLGDLKIQHACIHAARKSAIR